MHKEKALLQLQQAALFEYELVKIIVFSSDKNANQTGVGKREDLLTTGFMEALNKPWEGRTCSWVLETNRTRDLNAAKTSSLPKPVCPSLHVVFIFSQCKPLSFTWWEVHSIFPAWPPPPRKLKIILKPKATSRDKGNREDNYANLQKSLS